MMRPRACISILRLHVPIVIRYNVTDTPAADYNLHVEAGDGEGIVTLDQLIRDLTKGTGLTRAQAATELGKLRDRRAIAALIAALNDPNEGVRSNAAFALGEMGAVEAASHLARQLNDPEEWVRKSAAKALGMLKAAIAVPHLAKAIDDPARIVRKNAIRSLGQIGSAEALKALKRASQHIDTTIARMAQDTLQKLGDT